MKEKYTYKTKESINRFIVGSKLQTNKSREYLWSKINTPEKIINIEGFESIINIIKISQNNYELIMKNEIVILTFIRNKSVNLTFLRKNDSQIITWFEIYGGNNCKIVHGEYKRFRSSINKNILKNDIKWLKKHFFEELKEIAK